MEWWFRDRYRLPPTDPRFLDLTPTDLLLDYWTAHYAAEAAKGITSYEADDPDWNLDDLLARQSPDDDWQTQPHLSTPP